MTDNTHLKIGAWDVDPSLNRLSRDGTNQQIQPLSMNILGYLAEHAGEVVTPPTTTREGKKLE
jgi:DNA-binding winged helix-turn-helix (wHTH) protein